MNGNPEEVLAAVTGANSLSLAKLAVLERAESPLVRLEVDKLYENIKAAYLYSLPVAEAVKHIPTADVDSLVWLDEIGDDRYREIFGELVDAMIAFYKMLPSKKKMTENPDSETDGLQN